MWHLIAATIQQVSERTAILVIYTRTACSAASALTYFLAGLATLNFAVAETGLISLRELAEPARQTAPIGKEA